MLAFKFYIVQMLCWFLNGAYYASLRTSEWTGIGTRSREGENTLQVDGMMASWPEELWTDERACGFYSVSL